MRAAKSYSVIRNDYLYSNPRSFLFPCMYTVCYNRKRHFAALKIELCERNVDSRFVKTCDELVISLNCHSFVSAFDEMPFYFDDFLTQFLYMHFDLR